MKILFVCEGNVNRSQMAAAMLKAWAPDVEVVSAGVQPDGDEGKTVGEISEQGVAAMREFGFDIASATITKLTPQMVAEADKVVLMGPLPGAEVPEYLKSSLKLETWDVPDPGYKQISHTGARDMIYERVKELVPRIAESA